MKPQTDRNKILLLFVSVLLVAQAPAWIDQLINTNSLLSNCYGMMTCLLLFALPLFLSKTWENYASFDKTLLPKRWRYYLWIPVLVIVSLGWSILIGYIRHRLGYQKSVAVYSNTMWVYLHWILIIVLGPVCEELFWRGYALDQFRKFSNNTIAILFSSVLFGLVHVPAWGIFGINAVGIGIVFGYWRIRYKALLPLMITHALHNALTVLPEIISWHQQMNLTHRINIRP